MSFIKRTSLKVNLHLFMCFRYDAACRTSLVIHVKERSLKCICRDGRVMHMSYEPQELRDLILCQISQHQISSLQNLAKCMAWQILSNSNHLGIGSVEPLGNASSCVTGCLNNNNIYYLLVIINFIFSIAKCR